MTIVPADTLGLEQLAAVFNAGYEGYFVPMHVDAATVGPMLALWDVDLARSRVALRDGEPIGIVNSVCVATTAGSAASGSFRPNAGTAWGAR